MNESLENSFLFLLFLQAMDLDIPVLARNIPGNAAIIKHKETGLLFSTPQVRQPQILRLIFCHSLLSVCTIGVFLSESAQILLSGAACAVQGARPRCQPCWIFVGAAHSHLLLWGLKVPQTKTLQEMLWMCQISLRGGAEIGAGVRQAVAHQKSPEFQLTHLL